MPAFWLMKTEPDTYSFDQLIKDKKTNWNGVRNYQARNFMKEMKLDDLVLIYHSVSEKAVVGVAKIVKPAYPDKVPSDDRWVQVDIAPINKIKPPITLDQIKKSKPLQNIGLVRQGRLSVMPLTEPEYKAILGLK